jgi:hypothetical protein
MGIREAVNRNPTLAIVAVSLLVVVAVGVMLKQLFGNEASDVSGTTPPQGWFTVDDGKTWFAAPGNKVAPFDHNGKPAYRCYVWTCDGGKTKFVSHLERLKPAARAKYGPQQEVEPWNLPPGAEEVKLPLSGDAGWIGEESPQASQIFMPRCPDGRGKLEAVLAE